MRVKWENIIPLILVIALIVLLVKLPPLLRILSDDFGTLYDRDGDPVIGILALGLICITILGILKIISNSKH